MNAAPGGEPAIVADGLTRRFGTLTAVEKVSFRVPPAAIYGFLGPNGSGKSTIIRMLCGVLRPSAGGGSVLGHDIVRDSEAIKRRIGYMSQKFSLYGDLSVAENLGFYGRLYGLDRQRLRRRREELTDRLGLAERLEQPAGTLSGGWKQRLALACALVHEPAVLFLDEPTAGIDPVARRELWDLLFELSGAGITLFVTTHYMDEAERCTHVGYIYLARLIVEGKTPRVKETAEVTPAGTRRLELTCPEAAVVLGRLRRAAGVRDATLFGESLHLLVEDSLDDAALLEAAGCGAEQADLRPVAATLEDVFVTLSRREAQRRGV